MPKNNKLKEIFSYHLPTLIKAELIHYFPFAYSNFSFKKKAASLNITDRCNLRCIMCKQWRGEKEEEINKEKWKEAISQLKELGVEEINFTGGEPLLRDDICELTKYASGLGIVCGITTNGSLLDRNKANLLVDSGVNIFTLSIDGLGEDYDRIRGVGDAYSKAKNAAQILSVFRKEKKADVHISFVLMRPTTKFLKDVLYFCKDLNLSLVICLLDKTPYYFDLKEIESNLWIKKNDSSELKKAQHLLIKEKSSNRGSIYNSFSSIDFLEDYFRDSIQKEIPCVASQSRVFIDSSGNVFGGCWSLGSFGNIKKNSLKEITASTRYKLAHENMFFKKCPGCSCGYSTNLRYNLFYLFKEGVFNLLPFTRSKVYK